MPKNAHPMDVIRTCVSIMALKTKIQKIILQKQNMRKTMRIFAKTPTVVAAFLDTEKEKKVISPSKKLSFLRKFSK